MGSVRRNFRSKAVSGDVAGSFLTTAEPQHLYYTEGPVTDGVPPRPRLVRQYAQRFTKEQSEQRRLSYRDDNERII